MKIGITGATGQLGRLVVESLKNKIATESIVALVRNPEKAANLGVETRVFDYKKADTLVTSLLGIDRCIKGWVIRRFTRFIFPHRKIHNLSG